TNDIHIAALLRYSELKVIVTGGVLYQKNFILNGEITNQALAHLNVKRAFIATPAMHHERGLTHFDETLISAKINMIKSAKEVYVVTDHSKMNKVSLYTFGQIKEMDGIITDSQIEKHIEDKLREKCREVVIV